jgi:two-component system, OmpR family, phosphate regulon sensor histidine kinase PhoR
MNGQSPLRIIVAAFLIAGLALAVFQGSEDSWAAAAVIAAGIGTMAIFSIFSDPEPVQTEFVAPTPMDEIESAVIAAIAEPVVLVVDNRVRAANQAAIALLGAHIIGEDVRLAIRHPEASARFAPDAPDGNVELIGVGGADQRVELNVATIAPGKRVIHLIDRGARHAIDQARTDFVANASHELRTPLAAILGFIETLADDKAGADPEVRARFLDVMMKEARRMQRLIDDLISLSRIEAEKHLLPDETVSLPALVREVVGELGISSPPLSLEFDSTTASITGDRMQLSQLVHNLVGNAIKYGRPGTPVKITIKTDGTSIRLSITDEGEGIAPDHIPRLTERFYRVDAGRSRTVGGTGLGLAIVKHIVERHRGRLEITSKIGVGTVASVVFSAAPAPTVTETSLN